MTRRRPYRYVMDRRTLLRGAGGALLGLPFLDEMIPTSVYAGEPDAPVRAFNVFFGLGYQREIQADGLRSDTALVPLEPLVDAFGSRLAFLRGVDLSLCDGAGNAHFDGSAGAFTGTPANQISKSKNVTGGASLDQALRMHAHPDGLPPGVLSAIDTGSWWRFSDSTQRYIHSRLPDGTPAGAATPPQDPAELFAVIFGQSPVLLPMGEDGQVDAEALAALRMKRSVLDSLVGQYQHYTSEGGGLGAASRARVRNHFEQVRAAEIEVAQALGEGDAPPRMPTEQCSTPDAPGDGWYGHRLATDAKGAALTVEGVTRETQLMARLFALGVACDRIRFGTFIFQSGGERITLEGDYDYGDRRITFADEETTHEYWHNDVYDRCREHLHFTMSQIRYFLEQLDGVVEAGQSVVDTSLLTIATESGQGRHYDGELRDVLHVIGSGGGRFQVGQGEFLDVPVDAIDLYNTMLAAYGVPETSRLWDGRGDVTQILV